MGEPLDRQCDSCVMTVCSRDPYCCSSNDAWDAECVGEAVQLCAKTCGGTGGGSGGPAQCSHDKCEAGVPLVNGCDPCVASVCAHDSFCCAFDWDNLCVGEVEAVCGNGGQTKVCK